LSRSSKLFDELFPRTAAHFSPSVLNTTEWLSSMSEEEGDLRWRVCLLSDDLLKYCASFREVSNLFVGYKFSSNLASLRECFSMAKQTKKADPIKVEEKAPWIGFLDFRLTDEHLAALDEWQPAAEDIWAEVDTLITTGYRLTLSYNKITKVASVTIIDDDAARKTGGYALSSSDTDGALALKMAVYKHVHALDRNWEVLLSLPGRVGRRG